MSEKNKFSEEEHKKFAIGLFNLTWTLLDKKDRTKEEDDKMIHGRMLLDSTGARLEHRYILREENGRHRVSIQS